MTNRAGGFTLYPVEDTSVAYGWRHFDQGRVGQLVARNANVVDALSAGFVACPLIGHAHEPLSWLDANARRGTDWHAEPGRRFHASPTFVLRDPLRNIIVGHDQQAVASGRVNVAAGL